MASANTQLLKHIWTHEVTLKFIDLYKTHAHLWDREHPEYGKIVPRINSWHQMSSDLNLSEGDLKLKMTKLRQTFGKNWKNNKILPYVDAGTDDESVHHKWIYYKPMELLKSSYRINDARRTAIAVRRKVNTDRDRPSNVRLAANKRPANKRCITIDSTTSSSDTESEAKSTPLNESIKKLFSAVAETVIEHPKNSSKSHKLPIPSMLMLLSLAACGFGTLSGHRTI